MTPRELERAGSRSAGMRAPAGKTILYMTVLSVLFWWLSIEAYPIWTKLNLSPGTILTIPIYAFAGGLLTGFCAARSRCGREAMTFLGGMVGLLVTLFMASLLLGAFAILLGFSTDVAEWVRGIALTVSTGTFAIILVRLGAEVLMDKLTGAANRTGRRGE